MNSWKIYNKIHNDMLQKNHMSKYDKLLDLQTLYTSGLITKEDFEKKAKQISSASPTEISPEKTKRKNSYLKILKKQKKITVLAFLVIIVLIVVTILKKESQQECMRDPFDELHDMVLNYEYRQYDKKRHELRLLKEKEEYTMIMKDMVFVEGGDFLMGETPEQYENENIDGQSAHYVTVNDFYIGKFEVTQALFRYFMDNNPSYFSDNDNYPVENVSLYMISEFIEEVHRRTGIICRLPTEEEWEYAARGGKYSKHYVYPGSNNYYEVGPKGSNEIKGMFKGTYTVGQYLPNELGVYDMASNVSEICCNIPRKKNDYIDFYQYSDHNKKVVLRGGDWYWGEKFSNIACRKITNEYTNKFTGFRIVISAAELVNK